ncbi:MAG TPA: hypothetical protein VFC19_07280 [Candidatus Limnocylindrales bacterium]|nr:hypothetical protein [Candidatus Limnocylindrales bacterium]
MIDIVGIMRLIPHRYPILLIDRIVEVDGRESLLAVKAVTANEPACAAAPGAGYPPALLLESWCQAAGVLISLDSPTADVRTGRVPLFGAVTDVRFLSTVRPPDLLRHRVRLLRAVEGNAVLEGETTGDAGPVLQVGRVVVALRQADAVGARPNGGA